MFKKIAIFFVLSLSLCSNLYSQSRYGYLLADSSILSTTSVSNVLYSGIDNRLILNTSVINNYDTVFLKCNNGIVLFDSTYFTIPHRPGNLRIELHGLRNNVIDTIGYFNFKVLRLPAPKIAFGNVIIKDNMKISLDAFIKSDSLYIIVTEDIPDSKNWIQIKEFSIGYNYGGYFIGASSNSNFITQEMKHLAINKGAGRWFSVKVITQSATSLLLTNPIYKVFFY